MEMETSKKIKLFVSFLFRILVVLAMGVSFYKQEWFTLLLSILTLGLTFLPAILEKKLNVDLPEELEISILFLIFASIFLGEINSFYIKFWWWDLFLHGFSAMILTEIAFTLIYVLNREKKIQLSPIFIMLFTLSFAIAGGAIWEVFEFSMDSFLGTNMQKSGIIDTMEDIIIMIIIASITSTLGFFYAKGKFKFFKKYESKFIKSNYKLFNQAKKKKKSNL